MQATTKKQFTSIHLINIYSYNKSITFIKAALDITYTDEEKTNLQNTLNIYQNRVYVLSGAINDIPEAPINVPEPETIQNPQNIEQPERKLSTKEELNVAGDKVKTAAKAVKSSAIKNYHRAQQSLEEHHVKEKMIVVWKQVKKGCIIIIHYIKIGIRYTAIGIGKASYYIAEKLEDKKIEPKNTEDTFPPPVPPKPSYLQPNDSTSTKELKTKETTIEKPSENDCIMQNVETYTPEVVDVDQLINNQSL